MNLDLSRLTILGVLILVVSIFVGLASSVPLHFLWDWAAPPPDPLGYRRGWVLVPFGGIGVTLLLFFGCIGFLKLLGVPLLHPAKEARGPGLQEDDDERDDDDRPRKRRPGRQRRGVND